MADSAYNEAHLAEAGFAATAVIPPSAALDAALTAAAGATTTPGSRSAAAGARWLAVGRVSPNKALESTVAALAVARAHGDPEATLHIVGKPATDSYVAALHRYVAELGLAGAVRFAGHASDATVASAYAEADVLVVTSEHEGFCVPVVEAMAIGLPVVAFDQARSPRCSATPDRSCPTRIPTRSRPPSASCWAMPPAARPWSRRGAGAWPSWASTARPTAS